MKVSSFLFASLVAAQTTTYNQQQLSSASSAALSADNNIIMNFLLDFNSNYNAYVNFMAANSMVLPTAVGNYFVGLQTIHDETKLDQFIQTRSFPFDDIATMITKFAWYTDILASADASTFYKPDYFLTGGDYAVETGSLSSSTKPSTSVSASKIASLISSDAISSTLVLSSAISTGSTNSTALSSASTSLISSSSSSGSGSAAPAAATVTLSSSSVKVSPSSSSSSASSTASHNQAGSGVFPVISIPLILASLLLLL